MAHSKEVAPQTRPKGRRVLRALHARSREVIVIAAAGSVAAAAMTLPNRALGTASAKTEETRACEPKVDGDLSFTEAGQAALPLADKVVEAYHQANHDDVEIKRRQPQLFGMSYSDLTEVDIDEPVGSGEYYYTAQFSGSITANNVVSIELSSFSGRHIAYGFYLVKTDGGPENEHVGMQWDMSRDYGQGSNRGDVEVSKLANGVELPGSYAMTSSTLEASVHQAESLLEDMSEHRKVTELQNLNVSNPSIKICAG